MSKIGSQHLSRKACLYVRQSSLAQVEHHRESGARQYNLRERAVTLGWPAEQIEVIDEDQGLSGASAAGRTGFQRLVSDVALGGWEPFWVWRSAVWRARARTGIGSWRWRLWRAR